MLREKQSKRIVLSAVLLVACAEPPAPAVTETAARPIAGGVRDEQGLWPGVAQLTTTAEGTCTGTLIHVDRENDRALILTASHCVLSIRKNHGWNGAVIPFAVMGPDETSGMFGQRVYVHPGARYDRYDAPWDPWPLSLANDFAVLEVSGVHPGAGDWVLPVAARAPALGTSLTLVGVGRPNVGDRYIAENTLSAQGAFFESEAPYIQVEGAATPCPGDSGGPYIATVDGEPQVVGVHFTSARACGAEDQISRAGAVEAAGELIAAALEGRTLPPETCMACAADPNTCRDTQEALLATRLGPFNDCVNAVEPGGTFEKCSEQFPSVRAAIEAHWACLDATCAGLCVPASRILTLCEYTQDGGGSCDACIVDQCCEAASTCMNEPDCNACANTMTPDAACTAREDFRSFYGCMRGPCNAACGEYVGALVDSIFPPQDAAVPMNDAALPDAAAPDAARPDASVPDAATPDATGPAATPDTGATADAPEGGGGGGCSAVPGRGKSALALPCGVLLLALARRRSRVFALGVLALSSCDSSEPCWTSRDLKLPAANAEGHIAVTLGPVAAQPDACSGAVQGTADARFALLASSGAEDPEAGPWTIDVLVDRDGPSPDPANRMMMARFVITGVTGPGDLTLDDARVTTELECVDYVVDNTPMALTGTLHLDRISTDCNDAQSRFGRDADCALDAAGTLTLRGTDADGAVRLEVDADFDVDQALYCPKKIGTPSDHK